HRAPLAVEPVRAGRAAAPLGGRLVPRLLARHLRRRPSGTWSVHVPDRAQPGPPAAVRHPSLSETAVTPGLIALRWLTFLSFMSAIGLFVLRTVIARPVGSGLRALSASCAIALAV